MNYDLESELRKALRPKQPSRDLMPAVRPQPQSRWKLAAAAALALTIGGTAYRVRDQYRAKDQLVFALRLTAVKLQHTRTQLQSIQPEKHL